MYILQDNILTNRLPGIIPGQYIPANHFYLAYFTDDIPDVLGHHLGIATDVEVRALLTQQAPKSLARLSHEVRHVALLLLQHDHMGDTVVGPGLLQIRIRRKEDLGSERSDWKG